MQYPLDSKMQYCYRNIMGREVRGDPRGFIARVEAARENCGLGVYEFSEKINQSGSYWSSWMSRHRDRESFPRADILAAMASVLEVPVPYLLGLGNADTSQSGRSSEEVHPPQLTDEELLIRIGAEPATPDEVQVIEEFVASARTGRGNLIPQNYDDMQPRKRKRQPKAAPHIFKLRISGTCMHKTLLDGEVVWFDTLLPREPVAIVLAVRDEHEAHVKRLVSRDGVPWLESDDGWSAPIDEQWRILAVGFNAQRALPFG